MDPARQTKDYLLPHHLLLSIAEQMKLPLLQIARQAELVNFSGDLNGVVGIQVLTANALRLIDAYSLSLQLKNGVACELTPEATSIASVLYDVNRQLQTFARMYNVQLELNIGGRFEPVIAHKKGLESAIIGLASAFIETLPAQVNGGDLKLQLATHRCRYGIVAGVYADIPGLRSEALSRGRKLYGRSRQPLVDVSHTSGAGIFVADAIFKAMSLKMHASRHHHLYGLGVVLKTSSQLSLV